MEIQIKKSFLEDTDLSCKMVTPIIKNGKEFDLYLEVEKKYKKYFSFEVCDSAVVCLLLYAMERGLDIVCDAPISERLYVQLNEYFIPTISKNITQYKKIKIVANHLANIDFGGSCAGTGLSCGVDSFYSILKNLNHSNDSQLNVKYLAYFNAGASGSYGGDRARQIFKNRAKLFETVSTELGCEFISVDSNMNEFLHQVHLRTHIFRTLCIPLALQKLFKTYYFSSAYEYSHFNFSYSDPANYEMFILPNLSTQNTRFVLVGAETTRQGKVSFIANNPVVQKYLNVCLKTTTNCGHCIKCLRTMLNLYVAGELEKFDRCFDIQEFYKRRKKIIRWALRHTKTHDVAEIVSIMKEKKLIKTSDNFRLSKK